MDYKFTNINSNGHVCDSKHLYQYGDKEAKEHAKRILKDDVSLSAVYYCSKDSGVTAVRR